MKRIQLVIVVGMMAAACGTRTAAATTWNGQAQPDSETATKASDAGSLHQVYGTIRRVEGSQLTVEARDRQMVQVDATAAIKSYRTIVLAAGRAVNVLGLYDAKGVLHAQSIQRAKRASAAWPPDH